MGARAISPCPHCVINGVSDGHCHNFPRVDVDSGTNQSCPRCMSHAIREGNVHVGFFGASRRIVMCRVCQGFKTVIFDQETREVFPFKAAV
ncbi:MAG: hypothetical protein CMI52_00220 [Parcubacteria group bacterium]|nr:hypothetical protein [Parcubacteria group bacterium]